MADVTVMERVLSRHIGYFQTALEAAKAYDSYVVSNNLEHTLNGVL